MEMSVFPVTTAPRLILQSIAALICYHSRAGRGTPNTTTYRMFELQSKNSESAVFLSSFLPLNDSQMAAPGCLRNVLQKINTVFERIVQTQSGLTLRGLPFHRPGLAGDTRTNLHTLQYPCAHTHTDTHRRLPCVHSFFFFFFLAKKGVEKGI